MTLHGVGDNPNDEELDRINALSSDEYPTLAEIRFCTAIMRGESPAKAYISTFPEKVAKYTDPSSPRKAAQTLLKRPRVAKKMFELKKRAQELGEEDVAKLVEELNEDRKLARDLGQPSAAIAAVKTKASLLGIGQDNGPTTNISILMSPEQKDAMLSRMLAIREASSKEDHEGSFKDVTPE